MCNIFLRSRKAMKMECEKIMKFVYLQCYATASVNRGLLLTLLLFFVLWKRNLIE